MIPGKLCYDTDQRKTKGQGLLLKMLTYIIASGRTVYHIYTILIQVRSVQKKGRKYCLMPGTANRESK